VFAKELQLGTAGEGSPRTNIGFSGRNPAQDVILKFLRQAEALAHGMHAFGHPQKILARADVAR
jgi:hypothetical protein